MHKLIDILRTYNNYSTHKEGVYTCDNREVLSESEMNHWKEKQEIKVTKFLFQKKTVTGIRSMGERLTVAAGQARQDMWHCSFLPWLPVPQLERQTQTVRDSQIKHRLLTPQQSSKILTETLSLFV